MSDRYTNLRRALAAGCGAINPETVAVLLGERDELQEALELAMEYFAGPPAALPEPASGMGQAGPLRHRQGGSMTTKLGDRPAFPHMAAQGHRDYEPGLTVRQHAAIAAMQAILGWDDKPSLRDGESYQQATARIAVNYADALITRLESEDVKG